MKLKMNLNQKAAAFFYLLLTVTNLCAQPAYRNLDVNNINTRLYSAGTMFRDLSNPAFEAPKGSGKNTIFSGGLWIGGLDQGGQIHAAAETYGQTGIDYWSGPLNTSAATAPNPLQWDFVWKVDKSEVDDFIQNWNSPGYVIPSSITDWPGNSVPGSGFGNILAPFVDLNNNQLYEPLLGEYPAIQGDRALYFIYNDNYAVHTETSCNALGVEVHGMAYAFNQPSVPYLDNTIFIHFEIGNRSNINYDSVYVGIWTDFDIGNAMDDYVGTDAGLNMYYGYNGDAFDDGPNGYGANLVAQGVTFLNQPLYHTITYDNVNGSPIGNMSGCMDYYNYLSGRWLDNLFMTYGADGRNPNNPICRYMYPGNTDSALFAIYGTWTEPANGNAPGDRRMLGSTFFPQLPAGGYLDLEVAYTFAPSTSNVPDSSVAILQDYVSQLRGTYDNGTLSINEHIPDMHDVIQCGPNPASDYVNVTFSNPAGETFLLNVYDVTGKKVLGTRYIRNNKFIISRENLDAGMYVIKLQSEKNYYTSKIIFK